MFAFFAKISFFFLSFFLLLSSEAYLINGFVVHWFPSDDREFVVPSLGNFFFGYELGYSELGSVGYHY